MRLSWLRAGARGTTDSWPPMAYETWLSLSRASVLSVSGLGGSLFFFSSKWVPFLQYSVCCMRSAYSRIFSHISSYFSCIYFIVPDRVIPPSASGVGIGCSRLLACVSICAELAVFAGGGFTLSNIAVQNVRFFHG